MIAWTRNAVSVAEPSVWNQLDVARDLAEEEVLDAADEPGALLEPVERVERGRLDLRAAGGLRSAITSGTSIG